MKITKKRLVVCILFVFLLATFAGCRKPEEKKIEQETAAPVMVYAAKPAPISQYLKLTGRIEAENEAFVYSKSSEKLDEILVNIGDQVVQDQVLAIQANTILQQGIMQAKAALRSAQAQYTLVQQEYTRTDRLFREKIISQQQLDQVRTQFEAAEAGVEQARSVLTQAQEQYDISVIKSPFAGSVAMIFFQAGQTPPAGQPVFKIVHTSAVKSKLYVPEIDLAYLARGQKVIATFPALPDAEFPGTVDRIDEAIDPQKCALEIEVRIDNPDPRLKSGLFGQFQIEIQRRENAIAVPDTAVMTQTEVRLNDKGGQATLTTYYIYVVEDQRARRREVTPGLYTNSQIELSSGISAGDAVIVVGQNIVRDGGLVNVLNPL